jgi:hypothetical protein
MQQRFGITAFESIALLGERLNRVQERVPLRAVIRPEVSG